MTVYSTQTQQERSAAIDASVQALSGGGLVVLPTDTVYGLGADAFNEFKSLAFALPYDTFPANLSIS